MIVKTSVPRLKIGERYSLYDLLQPLLKESSNEAAVAISDFLGRNIREFNESAGCINRHGEHALCRSIGKRMGKRFDCA